MLTTADPAILAMTDAYRAAVLAKDAGAFIALYAPDVRVFDTWNQWSYEGRSAWHAMVAEWLGSLGSGYVEVEFADVRTQVSDDIAIAHAFISYTGRSAEGAVLHAMDNRVTWVLSRAPGGWRIVHEHTSAPVLMDTAKAQLQRPRQHG